MIKVKDYHRESLHRIINSVRRLNRALYHLLREEAEMLDSTVVQLLVLRMLSKHPNMGLSDLASSLQLGKSTMSGVVDRLAAGGLILRERSDSDRRTLTMRLTKEGEEKQKKAFGDNSFLIKRVSRVMEMPEKDLKDLFRLLDQLLEILENTGDEAK